MKKVIVSAILSLVVVFTFATSAFADSGGKPSICHYNGDYQEYNFSCYSDIQWNFENFAPLGEVAHAFKVPVDEPLLGPTLTAIDEMKSKMDDAYNLYGAYWVSLTVGAITAETGVGALAGIIGSSASLYYLVDTLEDIGEIQDKAYGYVNELSRKYLATDPSVGDYPDWGSMRA